MIAYLCKTKEINNIKTNTMTTQDKINNTFVKFMKSDSIAYEMNGEAYYAEWFEVSAGELGITEDMFGYFSVEDSIEDAVSAQIKANEKMFTELGYDLFKVLNVPTKGTINSLLFG